MSARETHVCSCGSVRGEGCAPVPFRDVCRFEQALADPAAAQLDAALLALEPVLRRWILHVQDGGAMLDDTDRVREEVRGVLAASAAVVLDRPPCGACGRPVGTGTLLDYKPSPPGLDEPVPWPAGLTAEAKLFVPDLEKGIPLETWREFAVRYRCPGCAMFENIEENVKAFHESGAFREIGDAT